MPEPGDGVRPADRSWTVAIYEIGTDKPVGSGVLIDGDRVLTCRHVVEGKDPDRLRVDFANARENPFRDPLPVTGVDQASQLKADVAVVRLASPAPDDVSPAPLRMPRSGDLIGASWWSFGFIDAVGNSADGSVGEDLSSGIVRLDSASRYHLEHGFSGAGLWSTDYQAVIGLVMQKHETGDGRAFTLHTAALALPDHGLADLASTFGLGDAGPEAAAEWGWQLATDEEGHRHWRPRARGVAHDAEAGWRFRGRRTALTEIVEWLGAEHVPRSPLVVTGSPGVGKSALLARIVTTADAAVAAELPQDDVAVRAPIGSVACAVHAKGKSALEVAQDIARAASAQIPDTVDDAVSAIGSALAEASGRPFTVVVDALDEATTPREARLIVREVLRPLAEDCAHLGVRVLVGTRRHDDAGELIATFGAGRPVIDLDEAKYVERADVVAYALATLQLAGAPRPDSPYLDAVVAEPVARRIAQISEPNFLVAGLLARQHGLHDQVAVEPASITLPGDQDRVEVALTRYLNHMTGAAELTPAELLLPLAYAETPGLTVALWSVAIRALTGHTVDEATLRHFASGAAANFLIQSSDATASFRLFHQALNDTLVSHRLAVADQQELTRGFARYGAQLGWERAPAYLLRSLPQHARAGQDVDTVLADLNYVVHADLGRLIPAGGVARSRHARAVATLIRRTPQAIGHHATERLADFTVTDALDRLDTGIRGLPSPAPYRAVWAQAQARTDLATLTGHTGVVWGVCPVEVDGRTLLASAGDDGTVRLWDPATGDQVRELTGHTDWVRGVCPVEVDGRSLLASAGGDRTVRLWDPATGDQIRELTGHTGGVWGVCPVEVDGRSLLASAGGDRTVRLWDPATGDQVRELTGHTGGVWGVCPVEVDGRSLLASAGGDGTIRLWDPATGDQIRELTGHTGGVNGVCPVEVDGRTLLASAGDDGTVRLWDPATGDQIRELTGHTDWVNGVCPVEVDGRTLLASAGDGTVRLWDPATGDQIRELTGHTGGVSGVCPVEVDGRSLLASAGGDRTVRLWDPATGDQIRELTGHTDWVNGVCPVEVDGRTLLASAGDDGTVRLWDPATGDQIRELTGHTDWVRGVCPVEVDGRTLLASASGDGTVRLWDPATGDQIRELTGHTDWVRGVCPVEVDGRTLLASASGDGTVRLWDPATGDQIRELTGHTDWVSGVCPVEVDGRTLLASAGDDGTVRLWDPATGDQIRELTGHTGRVRGVCPVEVDGRTLLASASGDRTVRLWDPATGDQIRELTGHTGGVNGVCPVEVDGRSLLASAGDDRTVRLWDPATGRVVLTLLLRDVPLAMVSDSPRMVFIGLDVGVLRIRLEDLSSR